MKRLSPLDVFFRALAIGIALEIVALAYNLAAHPGTPGIIGQSFFDRALLGLFVGPILLLMGAFLLWRLPGNVVPRYIVLVGVIAVGGQFDLELGSPFLSPLGRVLFITVAGGIVAPSLGYLMMHFPTGQVYPPRLAPWVKLIAPVKFVGVLLEVMASPGDIKVFQVGVNPLFVPPLAPYLPFIAETIGISGILMPMVLVGGMLSLLLRYRAAATTERRQIKWVAVGMGAMLSVMLAGVVFVFGGRLPIIPLGGFVALASIALLLFIASIVVAIVRYRLYDIDFILNRALVYGALTAIIVALYALVVGSLGVLFQTSGNLLISLVATGLIAVLFQPLRERLQRGANRLIYGERDEPYVVLSKLGARLEATLAPAAVLPAIAESVAQALRLPYAAIELTTADGTAQTAAHYPPSAPGGPPQLPLRLPLVYQTETIGQLILAPRTPGEAFTPADMHLLQGLAHQAGIAAHSVRLTHDLQRSREQLVMAREEERRRIRRDLHDGLGPALAGVTLKLDAARNLLRREPAAADQLLVDLKAQTQAAIADIRRLVYDLRPPALDQLGLVSALREQMNLQFSGNGLHVELDAPEALPPLPAAVEVAAYRIALEALTNVARHAHARHCTLRLTLDDALQLEVRDDGAGLQSDVHSGVGLTSMRERAAELGGTFVIESAPARGTRVSVRLPVGA